MSARSTSRPTWQTDICPSWCVVEHAEHDPPDDRVHDGVGHMVPAALSLNPQSPTSEVDLLVMVSRRCNTHDDWVFIGEPQRAGQHLGLSRESTVRLVSILDDLLAD